MNFSSLHPYVHLATRYPFAKGQSSAPYICYMSSIYLINEGYGTLDISSLHYFSRLFHR